MGRECERREGFQLTPPPLSSVLDLKTRLLLYSRYQAPALLTSMHPFGPPMPVSLCG